MIFDNDSFAKNYRKFHDDEIFKYHDVFLEKYIENDTYVTRGLDGTKNIVKYNDDKDVELLVEENYYEDDEEGTTECITTSIYNYYDKDRINFGYTVDIEITYFDHSTGIEHYIGNDKSFYKNTYEDGLLVKLESNTGYWEEMEYENGLVTVKHDSKNPHKYYQYNDNSMITSLVTGSYETIFEYIEDNHLSNIVHLKNGEVLHGMSYAYSDDGLLKYIEDLDDNYEEYEYDMNGRIVKIFMNDMYMDITYDNNGHLKTVEYDNGYKEEWDFRADGVLISYGDNEGEVFINDVVHYNEMDNHSSFPISSTVH